MPIPVLPGQLRLGASNSWRSTTRKADGTVGKAGLDTNSPEWKALRMRIMERDKFTCQYCGFRAKFFQICHHLDGNPEHNEESNLTTVCQACNAIVHCGFAGMKGYLEIWRTGMDQVSVVRACREAFRDQKYGMKERHEKAMLELTGEAVIVDYNGNVTLRKDFEEAHPGLVRFRTRDNSAQQLGDVLMKTDNVPPDWAKDLRGVFTSQFDKWQLEFEF